MATLPTTLHNRTWRGVGDGGRAGWLDKQPLTRQPVPCRQDVGFLHAEGGSTAVTNGGENLHRTHRLRDHDAVGVAAERADRAGGAQRAELVEHRPQRHVVAVVHPAGEHHVATARAQFGQRGVDRQQGARASRVDGVGGAAEVEPVGDARGRQVGHEADRRLRTGLTELGGEGVPDRDEAVVVDVPLGQVAGEQLWLNAHGRHTI